MTTSTGKKNSSASTGITVLGTPSPIEATSVRANVVAGTSISQILGDVSDDVTVELEGVFIPRGQWSKIKPKNGTLLSVSRKPRGDNLGGVLAAVVLVVVAVYAPYLVPGLAGTAGGAALTAGIMIVGGALLAPQPPSIGSIAEYSSVGGTSNYNAITSTTNAINKYGVVTKLFGNNWVMAPSAATPYTEVKIDQQFVHIMLAIGYGNLRIMGYDMVYGANRISASNVNGTLSNTTIDLTKLKIGQTTLDQFNDWELQIGYHQDIDLFISDMDESRIDVTYAVDVEPLSIIRTTAPNVDSANVDLTFGRGLFSMNDRGTYSTTDSVAIRIQYSITGQNSWTTVNDLGNPTSSDAITALALNGEKNQPFAISNDIKFPSRNTYDIRVTRVSSSLQFSYQTESDMTWTVLRSITRGQSFDIDNVLLLAMRIKATDQISGSLDNVRVYTQSLLPNFDETGLLPGVSLSNNPASAYLESMIGVQNTHPIPLFRIDFAEIKYWHDWCMQNNLTYNNAHSSDETLIQRLSSIPPTAFANHNIVDGKFSIIMDKSEPVSHVINPRNTKSFSAKKQFVDLPHAFRVEFTDADTGQTDEVIAYADGFNASNATKFESLQTSGITDSTHAWKYGRYHLAQATLRPETYTVDMDIEQLRVTRGDTVKLAYDVMLVGVAWGRIESFTATTLTIDEALPFIDGTSYSMLVRKSDGTTVEFPVTSPQGEFNTIGWSQVAGVSIGDVVAFGESSKVYITAKVTAVSVSDDNLGAKVSMVDAALNIFDAWTGTIPPFTSNVTLPIELKEPSSPFLEVAASGIEGFAILDNGDVTASIIVSWTLQSSPVPVSDIEIRYGRTSGQTRTKTVSANTTSQVILSEFILPSTEYNIEVVAISPQGVRSTGNSLQVVTTFGIDDFVDVTVTPTISNVSSGTSELIKLGDGTILSRMSVEWNKPITRLLPESYVVEYSLVTQPDIVEQIIVTGGVTKVMVSPLLDNREYRVSVRARYSPVIVSDDAVITHTVVGKTEPPDDVTGVDWSINKGLVSVSWDENTDIDLKGYMITNSEGVVQFTASNFTVLQDVTNDNNSYSIVAVDTSGNLSVNPATIVFDIGLQSPQNMQCYSGTAQLVKNADGSINTRVLVQWQPVTNAVSYEVRYKLFSDSNWDTLYTTGVSLYANSLSDSDWYNFEVRSVSSIPTVHSAWSAISHLVEGKTEPPSDVTNFEVIINDRNMLLSWNAIPDIDSDSYEIRYGGTSWGDSIFIATVKTTSWLQKSVSEGTHVWRIKALDTTGNYSTNDSIATIVVSPPTNVVVTSQVIDNNVLLYWNADKGTLDIDYYNIYKNNVLQGSKKGEFTTLFETTSGLFEYSVSAVDIAGNSSQKSTVTVNVSQPPDYVLNVEWSSDWSGQKTNAVIDNAMLYLPVNTTETFEGHFLNNGFNSPQAQVDAGYPLVLQPAVTNGSYEQIFDYGTVLASTLINVILDSEVLAGSPVITINIHTSLDGVSYTAHNGVSQIYTSNIRYVKIEVIVTGDDKSLLKVSAMTIRLDNKIKNDMGNAIVTDANLGKKVWFNVGFIDVESIITSVASGSTATHAIYDFVDIPHPEWFTVYLYDSAGNKVTGSFSWSARGY